jgi:DNA/RNA-binding domain of Phe-tRNA-synthetase-like protein
MTEIRIHENIFKQYPTFRRGIVVAAKIQNQGHSAQLESILTQAVAAAAEQPMDLQSDPRLASWNQVHRQFNSNPNKFPPAHFALLKRVQKPGSTIPFINKTVAIMNTNSIKAVMPVGGDDLTRAGEILELRYADGSEIFTPLGQPEIQEHPLPGEVIYVVAETGQVMCRRWNWRNSHQTRITETTHAIVMNIDAIGENSQSQALATRDQVARMLEEYCQAETIATMLSPAQMSFRLIL